MRFSRPCVAACAALAVVLAAVGCGGDEDLGVNNVSPTGSVGGLIIDAATRAPMKGVKVTIIAGGRAYPEAPAQTDDSGRFGVEGVPSGNLIVRISGPATHAPVELTADLQSAAGDFPLANATLSLGPIGLVPLSEKTAFTIKLVRPDGQPASAVDAQLRAQPAWVDFSNTTGTSRGNIVVSAKSSAVGLLSFKGIPDYRALAGLVGVGGVSDSVRLTIPPQDLDNDGVVDFVGTSLNLSVNKLSGSIPTVVVGADKSPALQIVATTIPALAGRSGNRAIAAIAGPLFVVFNWPIIKERTSATLYDELGQAASKPTLNVDGNSLQMSFTNLKPGAEYNLNLQVVAQADGHTVTKAFGAPFFTPAAAGSKTTVTLTRDINNPRRINVLFNEPVGTGVPQSLTGANSPLYFDYDINGSGAKGDAPGEVGASSSPYGLFLDEIDPPGAAGRSGLSSRWHFTVPQDNQNNELPVATTVQFLFSRMAMPAQLGNGNLAEDLTTTIPN